MHAHVYCSYTWAHARIDLKIHMVNDIYVEILSFKYEKNPFRGCGEIDVLLAKATYPYVLHVFSSISKNLAPKSPRFLKIKEFT